MEKNIKSVSFYKKIAAQYEQAYKSPYWNIYHEITWRNLKRYLPKNKGIVLDIGGGTGFWSRKIAKLGYPVICADLAEEMLEAGRIIAKKEGLAERIRFMKADILDLSCFKKNYFSFIIAQGDVLSYCGNHKKAIQELVRIAKRGAYINASVDNFYCTLKSIIVSQDKKLEKKFVKGHISKFQNKFSQYNFTPKEIGELFCRAGMNRISIIGKPIFAKLFSDVELKNIFSNRDKLSALIALEEKFNAHKELFSLSGHIEITGKKK